MSTAEKRRNITDPHTALAQAKSSKMQSRLRQELWHLGASAGALNDFTPADLEDLTLSDNMRHAAIAAEAGLIRKAATITRRVLRDDPGAFLTFGFAGLLDSVAACDGAIASQHAPLLEKTGIWRSGFGTFERLVRDPGTSVCVVGNAPALAGQGHGADIDSHDIVIRFNNFRTGGALAADTGHRTDIWVRTAQMQSLWRRSPADLRCAVIAGHPAYWRSPAGLKVAIDAGLTGLAHDVIDPLQYFDITTQLGAKPSNGIALLGWLRALRGSLSGITIAGFSLNDQSPGEAKRYFSDTQRNNPVPHDWNAERALLDTWLAEFQSA